MIKASKHFIEAAELSLSYDGRSVLSGASFQIEKGDYLCIMGENGSGKSTLIKAILGLKKPTKGELILSSDLKRSKIGYLPQLSAVRRDFPATVCEVVRSGCLGIGGFSPFYSRAQKKKALESMELLGIDKIASYCFRELSGGQQQRTLLARALCCGEQLLVLDEPISGLDPVVGTEMYKIVKELCFGRGITVIMVTHDLTALEYANKVLHLGRSESFFGSAEEYKASPFFGSIGGGNGE